jgi:serine/threonine-protein kinase
MTELSFTAESLCELQVNDRAWIGNTPYFVRQFSRGGMGFVVFLRRDDSNFTPSARALLHGPGVAIKSVLHTEDESHIRDLFHRELTVWSGLEHFNIVRLNEILTTRADGWIAAMDWCGGSLKQFLDDHGPLGLEDALFVVRDLLAGLHFAFSEYGVLHLDIKPANILYQHCLSRMSKDEGDSVRQFTWKVSDWGLASVKDSILARFMKSRTSSDDFVTLNNMGTCPYMAPERFIHGVRSSVASDLFAVGLVFYELLTGDLPYQKSNPDVVAQLCSHSYFGNAKLTLSRLRVPKPVVETILSLIEPDPILRCNSYREINDRIEYLRRPRSLLSRFFKS